MRAPPLLLLLLLPLLARHAQAAAEVPNFFAQNFVLTDINGHVRRTGDSDVRGKVLLIVNVASACGYTDANYRGLQALHERFVDSGLEILAFPCNQFGQQEPGSAAEIQAFARDRYKAGFTLMAKGDVNGPDAAPMWAWLKDNTPPQGGDLGWNFVKFLVGRDGVPYKRYGYSFDPEELARDVELLLAADPTGANVEL